MIYRGREEKMNIRRFLLHSKKNVTYEGGEDEDGQFEDSNQEINHFGELLSESFLTEYDYMNSKFSNANIF